MNKECNVIRDLLPLYVEEISSKETNEYVEKHLEECKECKKIFEDMKNGNHKPDMISKEVEADKNTILAIKKKMRNKTITTILSVIAVFALLIGGYFLQKQIPVVMVPGDEISVLKTYRYKTEDGYKLFVITEGYSYEHSTIDTDVEDNGETLILKPVKPFISQKSKTRLCDTITYDFGYESGEQDVIFQEFNTVKFGNQIIWTASKNAKDTIPDYVYAYDEFCKPTSQITGWSIDKNENWIEADYSDGTFIRWNLEGDVIIDTHSV